MKSFQEWIEGRDSALETIGFSNYAEYLTSDLWDWIRSRLDREARSDRCVACGSTCGLAWHHGSYHIRALVGNFSNLPPLIFRLCSECHTVIHTDGDAWFGPEEVHQRLNGLRRGCRRGLVDGHPGKTREEFLQANPNPFDEQEF